MIYRYLVSSRFSSAVGPDAYDVTMKAIGQLRGKFRRTSKDSESDAEEYLAETDEGFLSQGGRYYLTQTLLVQYIS